MPNELFHLRVGSWVFHPDAIMLPMAGVLFIVMFFRAISANTDVNRTQLFALVMLVGIGAVFGARLYGLIQPIYTGDLVLSDGEWKTLRFGSMGGIWGALVLATVSAKFVSSSSRPVILDCLIPAICYSAAVARVSCIFQGCCVGNWTGAFAAFANPIYTWPLLDLGALLITLFCIRAARNKIALTGTGSGVETITFLIVYGFLRFSVELLRDTYTMAAGLTWGQGLALAQIAVGVLLILFKIRSNDGVRYPADASDTSPNATRELA